MADCTRVSDAGLARLAEGPPAFDESEEVQSGARSRGLWATLGVALGGGATGLPRLEALDLSGCTKVTATVTGFVRARGTDVPYAMGLTCDVCVCWV